MKTNDDEKPKVHEGRLEYNVEDKLALERNTKAKKILICGFRPDEYSTISSCTNKKEIWDALQITHERTNQVNKLKIDIE